MTSQLGLFIALEDSRQNASVLNHTSVKPKRITRNVLAGNLFAEVNAFDNAITLRITLNKVYGRLVPLVICTYSRYSFHSIFGITETP